MENVVKVLKTKLKTALSASATSIVVEKFVDSNGDEVTLADFGTDFVVVISQSDKIEIVRCDGVTQSASTTDASATLSVMTNGRSISPKTPFTGSSTGKTFQVGAEVIVTNDPYTMSLFAKLGADNAFTGANTFTQFPKKLGSTTPVDDEDFVTLAHLNAVALGDTTVSSLKSSVTFGEDVSEGDPVYFKTSDQKWWRAYANDASTCIGVQLGIVQADAVADATGVITRKGRDAKNTGLTAGSVHYLTDAGGLSTTAGTYIVELGTAYATGVLDFEPKDGDREQFLNNVTGMLVPFAIDTIPSGFLACDGALYTLSDYPDLVAKLATDSLLTIYGLGTGTNFTVTAANDTIDITSHSFTNGQQVTLSSTGTLPAGLSANTVYYVVESTTNTFKLSLTSGGSAIDITDTGSGTHSIHTQFKVPDMRGSAFIGKGQKTVALTFVDGDVNTGTDVITVDSNQFFYTGQAVTLTTTGTLPTGLSATTYYVIRVSDTTIKLATSVANANDGDAVNITAAAGGGTHTLTLTMTDRSVGDVGGNETGTEVPAHSHTTDAEYLAGSTSGAAGGGSDPQQLAATINDRGGDAPNNMPPFLVGSWAIKT